MDILKNLGFMTKRLFSSLFFTLMLIASAAAQDADSLYAKDLLEPSTQAPDFALASPSGKVYSLKDHLGKGYLVLDFWASWCGDCRKDIPAVKTLYEKYGDRVTFWGISFDDNKEKWTKCIEQNGMGWIQLSELKKWKETEVSKLYHINWIPTMYLISPQGKVVLATTQVEKLATKLAEVTR